MGGLPFLSIKNIQALQIVSTNAHGNSTSTFTVENI